VQFYAPLGYNVEAVVQAGQAGGPFNKAAMGAAVGQFGTFDYQRGTDAAGNPTFYTGFTPVSNFDVGAYIYGTGIPQWGASLISNAYATVNSSNGATAQQALYRNAGYSSAASGGNITCSRFPWGQ
jgi:hypothetical protein